MMKKTEGFTILEVMLIVILISILAAIVIPRFTVSSQRAKVQSCEMNRHLINKQVEAYFFVEATWPALGVDLNTTDIGSNVNYFPDGIPTCPVDMTNYRLRNTPYYRVSGHREGAGTHTF
ncbi:MAG: type II secretion system protein [bacterium]